MKQLQEYPEASWEELKALCRAQQLVYQEKLLSLYPFEIEPKIDLRGACAHLIFELGSSCIALDEALWIGQEACLFGRILYRILPEWQQWRIPQVITEALLKQWKRDFHVVGTWKPVLEPLLQLEDGFASHAFVWALCVGERVPASKEMEEDLEAAGYKPQKDVRKRWYCEPRQVRTALELLLSIGWKVEYQGLPLVLGRLSVMQIEAHGKIQGTAQIGNQEVSLVDALRSTESPKPLLSCGSCWGLVPLSPAFLRVSVIKEGSVFLRRSCVADSSWKHGLEIASISESGHAWLGSKLPQEPNSTFQGKLRPYQSRGMEWLLGLFERGGGGILSDEMGLGKTIQVLAAFSHLPGRHIVVMPRSLLSNWHAEISRFLPDALVLPYVGTMRIEGIEQLPPSCILLISYHMLRQHAWLRQVEWASVVLDEAHWVKNSEAQITHAAHHLHGRLRIAVTGTPLENSPDELWTQLRFVEPELAGERQAFSSQFESHEGRNWVRQQITPICLRRTKKEVAPELPPCLEVEVRLDMGDLQYSHYQSVKESALLGDLPIKELLTRILRMRQIAISPELLDLEGESPKFEALAVELEECRQLGEQCLVFSQFASALQLARRRCPVESGLLIGETRDREQIVRDFQEGHLSVLFTTLKAGGVGLNLQRADRVILLDPWWNRSAERQAIDRAHRIGRSAPVLVRRYVMRDSVEENILALQEAKWDLLQGLWENPLPPNPEENREFLRRILS